MKPSSAVYEETTFLNVDLEIGSKEELATLVKELSPRLLELYVGKLGRLHRAHYETRATKKTAEATIRALLLVLKKLSPNAKRVWNRAHVRDFNVGVQAGSKPLPRTFEVIVERETLKEVAALGGRIVLTVYPSEAGGPA